MGPSFPCFFVGYLEHTTNAIFERTLSLLYHRFIDDILGISHNEEELTTWFNSFNAHYQAIEFKIEHSQESVNFLDCTFSIDNDMLTTTIHNKPMNSDNDLKYDSHHLAHCKNYILILRC